MDVTKFYTTSRDLVHHGLVCPPKILPGLYILDILAIVTNVGSYLDCLLICKNYAKSGDAKICSSADFVTKVPDDPKVGLCVLHGTSLQGKQNVLLGGKYRLNSVQIFSHCMHGTYL